MISATHKKRGEIYLKNGQQQEDHCQTIVKNRFKGGLHEEYF